jgi:hypothetical protein
MQNNNMFATYSKHCTYSVRIFGPEALPIAFLSAFTTTEFLLGDQILASSLPT